MKILGIDTTKKIARLFIVNDDKTSYMAVDENIKHSEGVFLYLQKILLDNSLELDDFDYFCSVLGPGSFTGIRVGMSIIKGFCKALNKDSIGINMFEIVSNVVSNGTFIMNSTSTTCYYCKYKNNKIVETGLIEKNKIDKEFDGEIYLLAEEQKYIDIEYNELIVINNFWEQYKISILDKIKKKEIGNIEPYYLQLSQAERNLKNE